MRSILQVVKKKAFEFFAEKVRHNLFRLLATNQQSGGFYKVSPRGGKKWPFSLRNQMFDVAVLSVAITSLFTLHTCGTLLIYKIQTNL